MKMPPRSWLLGLALLAGSVAAVLAWQHWQQTQQAPEGFASGNGRIEATEIDLATKLPGRLQAVLVSEGEFVSAGQELARMQIDSLQAQHDEALAREDQARQAVTGAQAQVTLRESDWQAARAVVTQRLSELQAAERRLARSEALARSGVLAVQDLDDDRTRVHSLAAALAAARAQASAAEAAIAAARTQISSAEANVTAAEATTARVATELDDSVLRAPRDGRVQYIMARPGEVLGAGGKVLNLVDLSDVYMTFFLPETVAGRVAIGSEARIVLDAIPHFVVPATVSFVASTAQFTPKTVETASERQKLMFRVRAQVDRELLLRNLPRVKTGLPGVAWVRLDATRPWPAQLETRAAP